ncbi:MAG: response regulator transcription factor [Anaerolineales bacterium]|jgi:DNA-binding response OmpR family regulator
MQSYILCLEGKRSSSPAFASALRKKGYLIEVVSTGKAALASLDSIIPDVVVVNAPSLRTSGVRICQSLRDRKDNLPVILISENGEVPEDAAVNLVLELPFTVRKLENRIKPFLPLESDKILKAGDLQLDLDHHQFRCGEREARLTPRLACLLEMLMRKPNEVITRETLFRKIWETDFTEDTRTLDVHISWLRKAIEEDPRNPKYLKTLRGVGYRLDI